MKLISSRGAFTLVELLVVISIIGVLVSLLLPALAKARESATLTKCQSQMRSIGQGLMTYATDQKNQHFPATPPQSIYWMYKTTGDLLVNNYITNKNTFYCPSIINTYYAGFNVTPSTWGTVLAGNAAIAYNGMWPCGYSYMGNPYDPAAAPSTWPFYWADIDGDGKKSDEYMLKLDQDESDKIVILTERSGAAGVAGGWDVGHPWRVAPNDALNLGGNNQLFGDAHVAYKQRKDIIVRWASVIGW